MKPKKEKIEGLVLETLPNLTFKIQSSTEGYGEVIAYLSGKMRNNRIKILTGDKVVVDMSPYDKFKGRIVYRL